MVKKISIVVVMVLLLSVLLTLVGCGGENYDFVALTGDTTGEVTSNGGIAVIKGNYLYYVNGYLPYSNSLSNKYGAVTEGCIMRMALADLDTYYQAEEADRTAILNAKSVIVVPKHIHYENTSDKSLNGIYIFGDRLYYFSTSVTTDKNGKIQSQWPVLLSCKLDGTDTKLHYTFNSYNLSTSTDATLITCLCQNGNSVYVMYVEGTTLNCLEVSDNTKITKSVQDIHNYVFDQENCRVYFTNDDKSVLYCYTIGKENKEAIHVSPADYFDNVTLSPNFIADGKLYYLVEGVVRDTNNSIYRAYYNNNGVATKELIIGPLATLPSSYLACDGYYIYPDTNSTKVAIYDVSTQQIKRTSALTGIVLDKIDNGVIYFYATNVLYRIDMSTIDWTSDRAITVTGTEVNETIVDLMKGIITNVNQSIWCKYDMCGDYVFIISNTSVTADTYDGQLKYNAIKVAHKNNFSVEASTEKQLNLSVYTEVIQPTE
ncbi:MAG: hypothetical protein PHW00_05130 [Clostridia bacterium]|nr:hypothetical protein [Clostridia bacterium]